MSNVIDLHSEAEKRRVSEVVKQTGDGYHRYVLELEHEILELQQQICSLHRDLERSRGNM